MKRWVLLSTTALLILVATAVAWFWWNQPVRTEMTLYVPAETLVYLEVHSLPDVLTGLISTEAWKTLAPAANLEGSLDQVGWLSRIPFFTGLGSAEAVVFLALKSASRFSDSRPRNWRTASKLNPRLPRSSQRAPARNARFKLARSWWVNSPSRILRRRSLRASNAITQNSPSGRHLTACALFSLWRKESL
ncbi:MAG: hypothetical protein WKF84_29410 [Pyrinomonadaceae bacterium]